MVDGTGEDGEGLGGAESLDGGVGEVVSVEANFDEVAAGFEHIFEPSFAAVGGETFVGVVEIAVVVGVADGKAFDDVG